MCGRQGNHRGVSTAGVQEGRWWLRPDGSRGHTEKGQSVLLPIAVDLLPEGILKVGHQVPVSFTPWRLVYWRPLSIQHHALYVCRSKDICIYLYVRSQLPDYQ